ncbi:MAG TPA: tetratricopeptide repeat protein [bacterium]|nr:tetratricopeptide repeat protein [bacterium]
MTRRLSTMLCLALALGLAACAGSQRKVSQYDLALYLQGQGKPDEAMQALQRSLAIDPDDPTPREALAQAYDKKGWRTQAVEAWEQTVQRSSDDPNYYSSDGKATRSQAWIGDAVDAHKRAVAALVRCYLEAADTAFKGARFDDAAKADKRVTELDVDNATAWPLLAKSDKKLKDGQGAYDAWKRCADLAPKDPDTIKELGFAAFGLTKLDEAEDAFKRYTALQPADPKGYNNQGTVLALLNRFAESQASFDKALAIQPDMVAALNGKATAYYYQKRYDTARTVWAHVLELSPDDPTATENIATLTKMGY